MKIRIQKFLSEAGVCSRRQAEEYIKGGLIKVNKKIINELGTKIDPEKDLVEFNNKVVKKEYYVYIILNKPVGYVSSFSHKGKKTLSDLIKIKQHLGYAGRLDEYSEGLMLLTNDGDLINKLTHPKYEHEKEYLVETVQPLADSVIKRFESGITLCEGRTNPAKIIRLSPTKFRIILNEGKNRQIRRMLAIVKIKVKKLKRIRIGGLDLGSLKPGMYRYLTAEEIAVLKKAN